MLIYCVPGADVNRQTSTNDHTVLSLASAGGHLAVVELLLRNGGDSTHKLKVGNTQTYTKCLGACQYFNVHNKLIFCV